MQITQSSTISPAGDLYTRPGPGTSSQKSFLYSKLKEFHHAAVCGSEGQKSST